MFTMDDIRIHGLSEQWAADDGIEVLYVFPGVPATKLVESVRMSGSKAQTVILGTMTADPDTQDLLDDGFYRWSASTGLATRHWVRHVLDANNRGVPAVYEFEGSITIIWNKIPSLPLELELLREGFSSALATWSAPASAATRAAARRMTAPLYEPSGAPYVGDAVHPGENAEHAWLRWCARFDDRVVRVGKKIYQRRRGSPYLADGKLVIEFALKKSEVRFTLDVSVHPVIYDALVSVRQGDGSWASTEVQGISWHSFESLTGIADDLTVKGARPAKPPPEAIDAATPAEAAPKPKPRAKAVSSSAPPVYGDELRLAVWESSLAYTLAGFELPPSKPLYRLAREMAVGGIAAMDALVQAYGPEVPAKLAAKGRPNRALIDRFDRSMSQVVTRAPSKKARQALVDKIGSLVRDGDEFRRDFIPGPDSEDFWRTWSAPPVLILNGRRYQLRQHEVYFGHLWVTARYGAGPGGDTPSVATLRLQVGLPDHNREATVIATNVVGDSTEQSLPWKVAVADLQGLTGDAIAARLHPAVSGAQSWDDALVDIYEAQDPRDPQLRLDRRLGSDTGVFVAFRAGEDGELIVARIVITAKLEIESFEGVRGTPAELAALRPRIDAALEAVRMRGASEAAEDEEGEDYSDVREAAIKDVVPVELMDRLAIKLNEQREAATLEVLRMQARTDLSAASQVVASLLPPSGPSPTEVASFLASHDLEKSASLLSAYIFTPSVALPVFAGDLAAAIDAELGTHALRRPNAADAPPMVSYSALRTDGDRTYVLEATGGGVRRHEVLTMPEEDDKGFAALDPSKLPPALRHGKVRLYIDESRDDAVFTDVWERFDGLMRDLGNAPGQLAEVRQLLAAAAVLIDVPKCQGQAKENALLALRRAQGAYEGARQQLHRGRDARAVDRLRESLREIAEVARQSAASCSSGQGALIREELSPALGASP